MGDTLPFSFAQDTHLTMNAFILLACVAASSAQYVAHPHVHGVVGGYPYAAGAYPAAYAAGAPVVAAGAYHPAAYAAAAPVVAAPIAPSSQFQAQDEFGNTQYGYSNLNSQKHEVGNTYTGVQGSYSYVDANGVVQTTNYIADGLGFRVQATNLPVAPVAPEVEPLVAPVHVYDLPVAPVYDGVAPAPVEDTPEVAAAKAAHLALLAGAEAPAAVEAEAPAAVEVEAPGEEEAPDAVEEEAPAAVEPVVEAEEAEAVVERRRRQTPANTEVLEAAAPLPAVAAPVAPLAYAGVPAGLAYGAVGAYAPGAVAHPHVLPVAGAYPGVGAYPGAYAYPGVGAYPYAAPAVAAPEVVRSAPAVADAELHTVKLNPGHAVAYRVY